MRHLFFLFLAVILITAPQTALAQSATSGAIAGTVTDPSGAIVPSVTVELTNKDTNALQTAQTNSAGQYTFTGVPSWRLQDHRKGCRISYLQHPYSHGGRQ